TRYLASEPERGHVIVFHSPANEGDLLVKRIAGLPGDLVDSRLGRLRIGGHTVPEPYVLHPAMTGAIPAQIVPAGAYFVLGDHREDSVDSRSWGFVPRDHIVGRARMVLWSSSTSGREIALADGEAAAAAAARARSRGRVFKWIE
ncbi:MAG TPA: signal peptidase I, partial [Thermoanaerobaculia bacterium]|nr:signal peptidase I [Thermoanaerobaculia bacterium]